MYAESSVRTVAAFALSLLITTIASAQVTIPTVAAPPTVCSTLQPSESYSETRSFKIYLGGCIVSYTVPTGEWNAILTSDGYRPGFDVPKYIENFSAEFQDSFDFLHIVLDVDSRPTTIPYSGAYFSVSSRLPTRKTRRLGAFVSTAFSPLGNTIENGPILHEILHEWANFGAVPTTVAAHWGFSSVGGQLGGFFGVPEPLSGDLYKGYGPPQTCLASATEKERQDYCSPRAYWNTVANYGNTIMYSPLELWSMGLSSDATVPPILIAENPTLIANGPTFVATGFTTFTIAQIRARLGAAAPDTLTAQRHFRIAHLVLTDKASLDRVTVDRMNRSIEEFSRDGVPAYGRGPLGNSPYIVFHNFNTATGGLATMRAGAIADEVRVWPTNMQMQFEFYNSSFEYYFFTGRSEELVALDRAGSGWARTGKQFQLLATADTGAKGVSRYYFDQIAKAGSRGSHFFTIVDADKATLNALNPSNQARPRLPVNEGAIGYALEAVGSGLNAACPVETLPLRRLFRGGSRFPDDPNHRFTTDRAIYDQFVANGWDGEGIAMCVPK